MGQTPGDDKNEPSLELPSLSLSGLGRRRKSRKTRDEQSAGPGSPDSAERHGGADEPATPADVPAAEPDQGQAARHTDEPAARTLVQEPVRRHAPAPVEDEPMGPAAPTAPAAPAPGRRVARERSGPRLPSLPGPVAAAATGGGVGLAGAAGTYAALAGCEAARGVSSCGGAPGFLILVAILVLMVLLGAVLLRALRVSDPTSTSFLAVGVVTVVVMLLMLDVIYSPWMFLAVPVLGALAFLLSHWVTTRFHDEPGRRDWA